MKCLYEGCPNTVKEVDKKFERQRRARKGLRYRKTPDGRYWRDYCSQACSGHATGEKFGQQNGGSNRGTLKRAQDARLRRFKDVLKHCQSLTEDGRVDAKEMMRATLAYGREEYQRGWKAGYKRSRKDAGYGVKGAA